MRRLYGYEKDETYLKATRSLQDGQASPEMQFRFRKKMSEDSLGDDKDHKSAKRRAPYHFDGTHVRLNVLSLTPKGYR